MNDEKIHPAFRKRINDIVDRIPCFKGQEYEYLVGRAAGSPPPDRDRPVHCPVQPFDPD